MSNRVRFDENCLTFIANDNILPTREGFLRKKGVTSKAFLRRWFVLKRNMLFYYERKGDKKPLGVILLEGIVVRPSTDYGGYVFEIAPVDENERKYFFEANSKSEMDKWIRLLSGSSYQVIRKRFLFLRTKYQELLERKQQDEVKNGDTENNENVRALTKELAL